MSDIVERLLERKTKVDSWIANCDRIAELMAPEMERFEKREGHNIYATRLAVDHESEKRGHVKHVEELTEAADTITALRAEVERLKKALEMIAEGDYDMPAETFYFPDKRVSKHNQCPHGRWMYDGCDQCCADFARAALTQTKDTADDA